MVNIINKKIRCISILIHTLRASMMKKFFLRLLLSFAMSGIFLSAQAHSNSPNTFKKPSVKQLYSTYKIVLGGVMLCNSFCALSRVISDDNLSIKMIFNQNGPDIMEFIFGFHMCYFAFLEVIKKPSRSEYTKIQREMCDRIAFSRGIKLAMRGLVSVKSKLVKRVKAH